MRITTVLLSLSVTVLTFGLIVGCGGGGGGAESPEAGAEAFFSAAAEGDEGKACENATESVSGSTNEDLSCEDLVETIRYSPLKKPKGYETLEESGDNATVKVTTASGTSFKVNMDNDDGWKVDNYAPS